MIRRTIRCSAVLCLTSVPLWASDHYVDVVNGNDANAGNSPATAWKTLTYASTTAPAGSSETIHVAPGVYSSTTGEIFPLRFHQQVLVADDGPTTTIIDGGGAPVTLFAMTSPSFGQVETWVRRLQGFTLRAADTGIELGSNLDSLDAAIVDCRIESMSTRGIYFWTDHGVPGPYPIGDLQVTMSRTRVEGAPTGISIVMAGHMSLTANDCSIRSCSMNGISAVCAGTIPIILGMQLHRCRFEDNASAGVRCDLSNQTFCILTVEDTLIARNGVGVQVMESAGSLTSLAIDFHRATIVDNVGAGVLTFAGSQPATVLAATFSNTIVQGNNPETSPTALPLSLYSWVGGPDPLFVDRAAGDYRLRFDSPCVDQGDPSGGFGTLDLAGTVRPIDGDLDTSLRQDIGAFEALPLELRTSGQIGSPMRFDLAGPSGGTTTVFFVRGSPSSPTVTPFGLRILGAGTPAVLAHLPVAPFPPVRLQRPIPDDPVLIGREFTFQGLTSSSSAPQGFAYTNVATFTVRP